MFKQILGESKRIDKSIYLQKPASLFKLDNGFLLVHEQFIDVFMRHW